MRGREVWAAPWQRVRFSQSPFHASLSLSSCCLEAQRAATHKRGKCCSTGLRRVLMQRMACPAHEHKLKASLCEHTETV